MCCGANLRSEGPEALLARRVPYLPRTRTAQRSRRPNTHNRHNTAASGCWLGGAWLRWTQHEEQAEASQGSQDRQRVSHPACERTGLLCCPYWGSNPVTDPQLHSFAVDLESFIAEIDPNCADEDIVEVVLDVLREQTRLPHACVSNPRHPVTSIRPNWLPMAPSHLFAAQGTAPLHRA